MSDLQKELGAALSFDPLGHAMDQTGRHHSDDATAFLGMAYALRHGQLKHELLRANNDTHWAITIPEWCELVESMGFALLLTDDVADTGDKLRIWWKPGVLLVADSYYGDKSINSSNAYFNFRGDRNALYNGSSSHAGVVDGQDVWAMGFDAREGLRYKLTQAESRGQILPTWIERPFLWLLHYMDTKSEKYDHKAVTATRIARLPTEVQAAIGAAA